MRLLRLRWLVVLALGLAAVGHLWWWYLPRLHRAQPSPQALRWLAEAPRDTVWVAYPHQNVGLAARSFDFLGAVEAGCKLAAEAGCRRPATFGPLLLPPATELVSSLDGRFVALRLLPTVRTLARIAGWLAGNPWLEGGRPDQDSEVSWRGDWWVLERAGEAASEVSDPQATQEVRLQSEESQANHGEVVEHPALAVLRLRSGRFGLEPGVFPIDLGPRGLRIGAAAIGGEGDVDCGEDVVARLDGLPVWVEHALVVAAGSGRLPRVGLVGELTKVEEFRDGLGPLAGRWVAQLRPDGALATASDEATLARLAGFAATERRLACLDPVGIDASIGAELRVAAAIPLLARRDRRRLGAAADLMIALAGLGTVEWTADGSGAELRWNDRSP